jgi:hypothetical protein
MIDLRLPLGLLFVALGAVMTCFGIFTHGSAMYARALDVNVNLIWGLIEIAFGASVLLLARIARVREP